MTVEGYRNPQSVTDDQRWLKITQRKSEKTKKGSQTHIESRQTRDDRHPPWDKEDQK
jgi:hypothetical protein